MVYIIAEIGVNHNGSLELAKKMIFEAYLAGVDAVKFQMFKTDGLTTKTAKIAEYQRNNLKRSMTQYEMIKKLEFGRKEYIECMIYAKELGIEIFATPFDIESFDFLIQNGMQTIKISSGDLTNLPLLERAAKSKQRIILSTGMATLEEIKYILEYLQKHGASDISILHCTSDYPTSMPDVNLNVINTFKKTFRDFEIGYSDHTLGIEIPIAATALGATIIEKHFTLSRDLEGPDHAASIEPHELSQMVKSIRNTEMALGSFEKTPTEKELKTMQLVRKSVVAKTEIAVGDIFTEENICTKRPGTGLSSINWEDILGKRAKNNYKPDELISKMELFNETF